MKKPLLTSLCLLLIVPMLAQNLFEEIDTFLHEQVFFGSIDYVYLKDNPEELDGILDQIASINPSDSSDAYHTAFYINAYNLLVIKEVRDSFPINSPKDIDGFFNETKFDIGGERLTLDQIEFTKLIEPTKDPRIHFSLGCAARSCPYLYDRAYLPETLEEQLDYRSALVLAGHNYVILDEENQKVRLSRIFEWYRDQFEYVSGSLIAYINTYLSSKIPEDYELEFMEYDWSLNLRK